jgi:hypothetical protein
MVHTFAGDLLWVSKTFWPILASFYVIQWTLSTTNKHPKFSILYDVSISNKFCTKCHFHCSKLPSLLYFGEIGAAKSLRKY